LSPIVIAVDAERRLAGYVRAEGWERVSVVALRAAGFPGGPGYLEIDAMLMGR
jgi:hypothetical protein